MRIRSLFAALAMVMPHVAHAQAPALHADEAAVRACFVQTPVDALIPECLMDAANTCQGLSGGSTTSGISRCLSAETAHWDAMLNEQYGQVRAQFARSGGDDLTTALRDAQRAWIAFRDAECGLQYQRWIGGTIRSVVGASCHLTLTARRTLALRLMAEGRP